MGSNILEMVMYASEVMEDQLVSEPKRFTTFAFVKGQEETTNVMIIGCFCLEQSVCMHHHIVGAIRIHGTSFPVIDEQILAGGEPRAITNESCIVLKNADESLSNFGTAVIVDGVSEMLSIAENVN